MITVAIIGAGQSGLVTCKTMIEQGFRVIVLEKTKQNGLFYNIPQQDYFTWSSSKYVSGFSDYPIPKDYPIWMTLRQYYSYLQNYKHNFKLNQYIQYSSEVKKIEAINNKTQWKITYYYQSSILNIIVDKLIVCTGLNSIPKYPNLRNYTGEVIHTDQVYRHMSYLDCKRMFSNKRILLLGGGESAFDIGHLVLDFTNQLYFTFKNNINWFPNHGWNKEYQNKYKACLKNLNPFLSTPKIIWNVPSDAQLSYLEYILPPPYSGLFQGYLAPSFWKFLDSYIFNQNKNNILQKSITYGSFKKYIVKRLPFVCDYFDKRFKIINYPIEYSNKDIWVIEKKKKVRYSNIDIIISATGYKFFFPFLSEKYYQSNLIKKIISPLSNNLAFIGFARPTMGSINQISEVQSWWVSQFFKNQLKYSIRNLSYYRPFNPLNLKNEHSSKIVIGIYYLNDLALDMKINPNMVKLFFTNFKLWLKILHTTVTPINFRINGQFKIPAAEKIILEYFPKLSDKNIMYHIYIYWFISYHVCYFLLWFGFIFISLYFLKSKIKINTSWCSLIIISTIITLIILIIIYWR